MALSRIAHFVASQPRVGLLGLVLTLTGISCAKGRAAPEPAVPTASSASSAPSPATQTAVVPPGANDSEPVARFGQKFRYASAILKEERAYWVDLPDGYEARAPSKTTYPVLYLLDAERSFAATSATVKFMSQLGTIPEMIVVGVPSTEQRMRDMTPTHSLKGPDGEPSQRGSKSGGAAAFLSSMQKELLPRIEAQYRTMPYRILAGHSVTGLFALYAFVQDPTVFQAVIAMDPSVWWDDQLLVKRAAATIPSRKNLHNSVYIGTSKRDISGVKTSGSKAATQAFYRALESAGSPTFRTKLQSFEDENHGSVSFPSFYYGMQFIFDGYQIPTTDAVKDAAGIVAHYRQFSEKSGAAFEPPETAFALLAAVLLFEQKKVDEAIAVLGENTRRHPSSPDAHGYLGQAYLVKEDKAAAIRCFERVLQLRPGDEEAAQFLKSARAK